MKFLMKTMDFVAKNLLRIVFSLVIIVGIFIKPMYDFKDFPYFSSYSIYDILMGIVVAIGAYCLYRYRNQIQIKFTYWMGLVFFVIVMGCYLYFVPLIPFSDMARVAQMAIDSESMRQSIQSDLYWIQFPVNVYVTVFWMLVMLPFPKALITMKLINAVFIYGTIFLTSKLSKAYGVTYDKVVYVALLTFSPLLLYANHLYFDVFCLFFCVAAMYIMKKKNNIILAAVLLGVSNYLRSSASIFLLAIAIAFLFESFEHKDAAKVKVKKVLQIFIAVLLFVLISKGATWIVKNEFIKDDRTGFSGWNQFYIGINEPEFGFMDGDFSEDRSFEDVKNRVIEYGPVRMTTIFAKKTFWLWGQGTYQAQRFGFGADTLTSAEKFEYETFLTKHLLNDEQGLRKLCNAFMRAQYIVLFVLFTGMLWRKKDIKELRVIYYIFTATVLIMLVYELKSRYILHCLPLMVIGAAMAFEQIEHYKRPAFFRSK